MIAVLQSTNPKLSWIINKNPENEFGGFLAKSLKKGVLQGFYYKDDKTKYVTYFRDAENEMSYSDKEFENLDTTRYNSANTILDMVKEFYGHLYKKRTEDDVLDKYEHSFYIPTVYIKKYKYFNLFVKYFTDFEFEIEEHIAKTCSVTIKTKKSLTDLINMVLLFNLFVVSLNGHHLNLNEDVIKKYTNILTQLQLPYFIAYVYKSRVIGNRKRSFNLVKKQIENNIVDAKEVNLVLGDTHTQRIDYLTNLLDSQCHLLDFGCGEGRYIKTLATKLEKFNLQYHGFDIDEEILGEAKSIALKKYRLKNVHFYSKKEEVINNGALLDNEKCYDVLLTEVIEHLELDDAKKLLNELLNLKNINRLVVTTPNSDFNKYYKFDDDNIMRHDDHKFELTSKEFKDMISEIIDSVNFEYNVKYFNIGDVVDGVTPTQGIIFEIKQDNNGENN